MAKGYKHRRPRVRESGSNLPKVEGERIVCPHGKKSLCVVHDRPGSCEMCHAPASSGIQSTMSLANTAGGSRRRGSVKGAA